MGNTLSHGIRYCCCSFKINDIYFYIEDKDEHKCDIILNEQNEINGYIHNIPHPIFKGVGKSKNIQKFISLINHILHNISQLTEKNINSTIYVLENILKEFLNEDDINFHIKNFNEFLNKKLNVKSIKFF